MRTPVTLAATCFLAFAVPAWAQQATSPATHEDMPAQEGPLATNNEVESLIGTDAVAADGRKVGTIENLLIAPDGRIDYVVLEWGGVAGLGERQVAVPWNEVVLSDDNSQAVIDKTQAQLEEMQRYDPDVPAAAGIESNIRPLR
ncbi:PRC-barrel domain-containing protein [Skermanella mucosa]|uniref:PRC-barrel domain-containing protein n=1 Tax=Skermanella mucosa TaxID=1789672 RepID=UPI00192C1267|nr:PRC-barrel domain-containing protein [Skermanella mucosa]UEM22644.1 PRC-barrel domain-containing protein [Skermanella mucosa]